MNDQLRYGVRLAVMYALVWFVDLLDVSMLNVALPSIAGAFGIAPVDAEWTLIGFMLAMTLGMSVSGWMGDNFGTRRVFLGCQLLYIVASIGCGLSQDVGQLIAFRLGQGLAGGVAIPLGMATLFMTMPQSYWARTATSMNMVLLVAPALGPLLAGYVTATMGWRWLFFVKLPLSLIVVLLSFRVLRETERRRSRFDWLGFLCSGASLTLILWVFSEVGRPLLSPMMLSALFAVGLALAGLFFWVQRRVRTPLIPLQIFRQPLFTYGNLIQSAANVIFLGATFLIALYLQEGLGYDIMTTGWVMAAIMPGMLLVQPFVGKFYNRLGPLPFVVPGLCLLALSMLALLLVTPQTPPLWVAAIIFLEGVASSLVQTTNVMAIFSEVPHSLKGAGSSIYSLLKQVSGGFGVALSTMILTLGGFHWAFLALAAMPVLALVFCLRIDNQRAIRNVHTSPELSVD